MQKTWCDFSPEALNEANDENLYAYIRAFGRTGHVEFQETDTVMTAAADINAVSMITNCVYRAKFATDGDSAVDAAIREVLGRFEARRVPVLWTTGPATYPQDLGARLVQHGMMHVDAYTRMAIGLDRLDDGLSLPDGLTIRPVSGEETLNPWFHIHVVGFELSDLIEKALQTHYRDRFLDTGIPAYHYIGYYKDKPVATASVLLGDKVAGIYNIVTLPEARRRGIAAAMTMQTLLKAKEAGYRVATLQATKLGAPIYRRIGFVEHGTSDVYVKMHGPSKIGLTYTFLMRKLTNPLRAILLKP